MITCPCCGEHIAEDALQEMLGDYGLTLEQEKSTNSGESEDE